MELDKLKEITEYARKNGIKSLKFGDVSIEFRDILPPLRTRTNKPGDKPLSAVKDVPTLDDLNDYIYGET